MRAILCILALATACQQPPGSNGEEKTEPSPETPVEHVARIRYAPSSDGVNPGPFATAFTLLGQRDIIATIDVDTSSDEPTSGVHFMRFDVLNTRGAVLQTQWQAFSYEAAAPTEIMHPMFQEMVDVKRVTADEGWVTLRASIPVAGAAFTKHRLLGEFTGAAYLGLDGEVSGADMPNIASVFEMEQ